MSFPTTEKFDYDDDDVDSNKSLSFDDSTSSSSQSPRGSVLLDDIESQKIAQLDVSQQGAEYSVATRAKLLYLAGYFALNLSLTLYNKAILQNVS